MMKKALSLIENRWEKYLEEVRNFLRMPSISPTGEGIDETACFLRDFLNERLDSESVLLRYGGHPIVYSVMNNGSDKTLILYNMYDVLPVEPLDEWVSPPFEANIIEDKIIARGAVNTKAPLMSMLLGIEALKDAFDRLPINLCFVLEGEEEIGSSSMYKFVQEKKEELMRAQAGYFMYPSEGTKDKPQIILGKKGIIYLELNIKTSKYDAHGSYVQLHHNPIEIASNIISTLKDRNGDILVKWLFDDVVTPSKNDLKYLPELMAAFDLNEVIRTYGIKKIRGLIKDLYVEVFFKPSINIDGIVGGYVMEGAKTITPAEVKIKMDFRLVPNMTPEGTLHRFMEHLEENGFKEWVDIKLFHNYDWSRTSPEAHIVKAARQAFLDLGMNPYIVTTAAGSAPEYLFTKKLKLPIITAAPGYGGRIHAPNEFIEVAGIRKMMEYMIPLIKNWTKELK